MRMIELLEGVALDHHVLMKLTIAWITAVFHENLQCDLLSTWSCSEIYGASGTSAELAFHRKSVKYEWFHFEDIFLQYLFKITKLRHSKIKSNNQN